MSKKFYLVVGEMIKPKIYKQLKSCQNYAAKGLNTTIKTFDTEGEAEKYLSSILSQNNQSERTDLNVQKEPVDNGAIFQKQQPTASISNDTNTVEHDEDLENEDKQGWKKVDIYKYFQENTGMFNKAKPRILDSEIYCLFFDGAARPNPGPAGCGYAVMTKEPEKLYENALNLSYQTNNKAEYLGVIYGMRSSLNLGIKNLEVYGDSQLVINQLKGTFKVGTPALLDYYYEAINLKKQFKTIKFQFIRREFNTLADKLSNKGIAAYRPKDKEKEDLGN